MGYDFLGTINQDQWAKLKAFTQTHSAEMGIDGLYLKHIAAELKKIQKTQADIKRSSLTFNSFIGDVPFDKELTVKDGTNYRYNLADGDTGYLVNILKETMKPVLKRKKDNIEYRYKKFLDLEEQYGIKLNNLTGLGVAQGGFQVAVENTMAEVETHFVDGLHGHNAPREGSRTNAKGQTVHSPDTIRVDQEATVMDDIAIKQIKRLRDVGLKSSTNTSLTGFRGTTEGLV